ncbi:hypothetical protein IscW_ISCW024148 [Ixodes scapularis]|uniref:Uncharacterized protein n=1 Tax=Ixodes scapularis TaxID=6945 RepID=B7PBY0_IXOSC|nr:hypothetical protein IscW_ISCW024148 [Ixodes scapularis]|eukprot:XP_002409059.1 hypothetical protein IscW_ISCW024148 [Ixodes scapularis]
MRVQTLNAMRADLQPSGNLSEMARKENNRGIERDAQEVPAVDRSDACSVRLSGVSKWAKYTSDPNFTVPDFNAQSGSVPQEKHQTGKDEGGPYESYGHPGKKLETKVKSDHSTRPLPYDSLQALPLAKRVQDPVRYIDQQPTNLLQLRPASMVFKQQSANGLETESSRRPVYSRLGTTQLSDKDFSVDF